MTINAPAPMERSATNVHGNGTVPGGRSRRRTVALSALVGAVVGLTCAAFVAARLASQWSDVRDEIADASLGWIAAALVLAAAGMTWIAVCWRWALALSGPPTDLRRTIAWYYGGEIGKYVPGGIWPVVGRGELASRGGMPRTRAYASVGLSLATLYLGALLVAAVLVPLDLAQQSESPAALALLALLPLGLATLHPRVLGWLRDRVARVTGRAADIAIPPWSGTVRLVVSYVPAWLLIAGATWCIARALLPDPPLLRLGIATTLSWTAGFAAVPVPAGAGVREAVFLAASGLDAGIGATVAVGSRLAFLVVDVAGAVLTSPWHRRSRPTAPPRPEPVAAGGAAEPAAAGGPGGSGGPDGRGDALDEASRPDGLGDALDEASRRDGSGDRSSPGDPGVHGGPGRIVASGRPDGEP